VTSFIASKLPSAKDILELPEDEFGMRILRLIVVEDQGHLLNRHNLGIAGTWEELGPEATTPAFLQAVVEAWDWLSFNRLVARRPGDTGEWAFVTRRGYRIAKALDSVELLRAEARLDLELHPLIAQRIRRQFLLGEYELAALAAMREVEIRVRKLSKADASDIGVNLMRSAFKPGGPLANKSLDGGEQEATMALFWGAIGVFKNPSSHRQVEFDDPTFAAEVVLLADLLLRMIDVTERRLTLIEDLKAVVEDKDKRSEAARKGHQTRARNKGQAK
jgi:uncharacterized protein (TIGR02391 family)